MFFLKIYPICDTIEIEISMKTSIPIFYNLTRSYTIHDIKFRKAENDFDRRYAFHFY